MIFKDGPSTLTGVLALLMVKPQQDGGAIARSHHGRIDIMVGPVITTPTAEMSAMIEALSFLGPCGPVARDANSCIYYDSKHAAGV